MLASLPRIGFGSELLNRADDFLTSHGAAIWFGFSPAQRPDCRTMLAFLSLNASMLITCSRVFHDLLFSSRERLGPRIVAQCKRSEHWHDSASTDRCGRRGFLPHGLGAARFSDAALAASRLGHRKAVVQIVAS